MTEVTTLRLGHGLDPTHPVHLAMEYMAEEVQKNSKGKMHLKIYPSNQLGDERECLELLQIGSLDITKVSAAVMENFVPAYKAFGMPYLFSDKDHKWRVLQGEIGESVLAEGDEYFLRGLGFYDAGSRSFYSQNKLIKTPKDLEGMKIRVMESQTAIDMVKVLGGSPTPISFGELYTALQQNTVDGAENNPPSFESSGHYEVCKYYTLDEHSTIPDVLVIGTHTWKKLSTQERKWLTDAVAASVEYQKKLWAEREEKSLQKIKAAGVEVYYPDKAPFRALVQPMYKRYAQEEPEIYEVIEKILAITGDEN